jgi:hypothetical protein
MWGAHLREVIAVLILRASAMRLPPFAPNLFSQRLQGRQSEAQWRLAADNKVSTCILHLRESGRARKRGESFVFLEGLANEPRSLDGDAVRPKTARVKQAAATKC